METAEDYAEAGLTKPSEETVRSFLEGRRSSPGTGVTEDLFCKVVEYISDFYGGYRTIDMLVGDLRLEGCRYNKRHPSVVIRDRDGLRGLCVLLASLGEFKNDAGLMCNMLSPYRGNHEIACVDDFQQAVSRIENYMLEIGLQPRPPKAKGGGAPTL